MNLEGGGVKQSVITFQEHNEFLDARKSKDSCIHWFYNVSDMFSFFHQNSTHEMTSKIMW